jgi:hypothetical protein
VFSNEDSNNPPSAETQSEANLVLDHKNSRNLPEQPPSDPFSALPEELRQLILFHLPSTSIGPLRLSSRPFRPLTKSIFRHLILSEMPWFWEIEALEQMFEGEPLLFQDGQISIRQEINWMSVWNGLKELRRSKLGVRNRVRIWNLAEDVVARIGALRRELEGAELRLELNVGARQWLAEANVGKCSTCVC